MLAHKSTAARGFLPASSGPTTVQITSRNGQCTIPVQGSIKSSRPGLYTLPPEFAGNYSIHAVVYIAADGKPYTIGLTEAQQVIATSKAFAAQQIRDPASGLGHYSPVQVRLGPVHLHGGYGDIVLIGERGERVKAMLAKLTLTRDL